MTDKLATIKSGKTFLEGKPENKTASSEDEFLLGQKPSGVADF